MASENMELHENRREQYRATAEALETFRAQELAAMTDERAAKIIQMLGAAEVWRDRSDWFGLVEQQAIFHRLPR